MQAKPIHFEFFEPEKHYFEIKSWWKFHNWSCVPLNHLPKIGIVVYTGDKMACAAWLYQTDSAICIIDWVIANPEIRKQERTDCLDFLITALKDAAFSLGFGSIFTFTRHSLLISRLEKHNFKNTSDGMVNLILNINKKEN